MSQYIFFVWNERSRIKCLRIIDLPDVEAARRAALKIAGIFVDVVPHWDDLSSQQGNTFVVEIVDEAGQTVLAAPSERRNNQPRNCI